MFWSLRNQCPHRFDLFCRAVLLRFPAPPATTAPPALRHRLPALLAAMDRAQASRRAPATAHGELQFSLACALADLRRRAARVPGSLAGYYGSSNGRTVNTCNGQCTAGACQARVRIAAFSQAFVTGYYCTAGSTTATQNVCPIVRRRIVPFFAFARSDSIWI